MRRETLINKLRELGYRMRDDGWRMQEWRHPTTLHRVMVQKRDILDERTVRTMLRQAGCSSDEVDAFVRIAKC